MIKKIILFLIIILIFTGLWANAKKGKIQVEVFGGFSLMNPADLNAYPEVWEGYYDFWHRQRHEYNVQAGYISSFDINRDGDFETIRSGFPLGIRIRRNVFKFLSLSLGFKTVSARASSHVAHTTTIYENEGDVRENVYQFSPLSISASGWVPMLGIHFEKQFNSRAGLEFYISGGPFMGKCEVQYDYVYELRENDVLTSSSIRSIEETGKDTGLTLEFFFRFNHFFGKHLGFFVEAGYVHQKVDSLDGSGVLDDNGEVERWKGKWGMKEYYVADYWGQFDIIYPSNNWEYPEEQRWVRDFYLDLSGFQVRIGLRYNF